MASPMNTFKFGPWRVNLVLGDLSRLGQPVDVIVSSDDNYLSHGGGVSAALWEAAGESLDAEVADLAPLRLGDLRITGAGDLAGQQVVHAVTLDLDTMGSIGFAGLVKLYGDIVDYCTDQFYETVATPLLGAGTGRVDVDTAVAALASALDARLLDSRTLQVILVVLDDGVGEVAARVLANRELRANPLDQLVEGAARVLPGRSALALQRTAARLKRSGPRDPGPAVELFELSLKLLAASSEGAPEPGSFTSLAGLLEQTVEDHRAAGTPLARSLVATCSAALDARTRLSVGRPGAVEDRAARRELAIGAAAILEVLVGDTGGQVAFRSTTDDGASGTSHVRKLHQLLWTELSDLEFTSLTEQLRARGYRGSDSMCVLEYCAEASPVDVLQHAFSGLDLERLLADRQVPCDDVSETVALALRLAENLGFHVPARRVGLHSTRELISSSRNAVDSGDLQTVTGGVARCAACVEGLLASYLAFVCQRATGDPPQRWAEKTGRLEPGYVISRASLGSLIKPPERTRSRHRRRPDAMARAVQGGVRDGGTPSARSSQDRRVAEQGGARPAGPASSLTCRGSGRRAEVLCIHG